MPESTITATDVIGDSDAPRSSDTLPDAVVAVYERDLRADRFLIAVHGDAADVDRARGLLSETAHERLDHHAN